MKRNDNGCRTRPGRREILSAWPVWALLAAVVPIANASAQDRYVDVWIRVFIPKALSSPPGAVLKTDNGLYVISAPALGGFGGTCFTTDQREFSPDIGVSSRVVVNLRISVQGRNIKLGQIGDFPQVVIGETHNVDCKSGKDLKAPMKADARDTTISDVVAGEFYRNFSVRISAGDPFYTLFGVGIAPKIDSEILFSYDVSTRKLKVSGTYQVFPSFEIYYKKKGGQVKKILAESPAEGSGPFSMFDFGTALLSK